MTEEMTHLLGSVLKLVLIPGGAFAFGFLAQFLLQKSKSRDELVRALAEERAIALQLLWKITTLPEEITKLEQFVEIPSTVRQRLNDEIINWYTTQGGALYLSWRATQLLFDLLDALRSEDANRSGLEDNVSRLRTQIEVDCGIYSLGESRRKLKRPKPAPWTANPSVEARPDGGLRPPSIPPHVEH